MIIDTVDKKSGGAGIKLKEETQISSEGSRKWQRFIRTTEKNVPKKLHRRLHLRLPTYNWCWQAYYHLSEADWLLSCDFYRVKKMSSGLA